MRPAQLAWRDVILCPIIHTLLRPPFPFKNLTECLRLFFALRGIYSWAIPVEVFVRDVAKPWATIRTIPRIAEKKELNPLQRG